MKVLFFTHYMGLYGANKSLLELIINMKKLFNTKAIVITLGNGEFNKELDKHNIENYSFYYYHWVTNKSDNKIKKNIKFMRYKIINFFIVRKILKCMKYKKFDIVHSNSSVIDIGAKIAKKMKIKHIWHLREFGEEDYDLIYYNGMERATRFINNYSDNVICISESLRSKYTNYIDVSKLKLIHNGINDSNYFINVDNKLFNNELNIIFTGLITPNKNQMELIRAIDILVNNKGYNISTYFLGSGDFNYLEELKQFCNDRNLNNNIFFEGRVENVKEYIQNSHIGVICSKNEAFGRVTVEYMMGGLAVIASNTGANPEIIENSKDGLIYELGNYVDLSNKIEQLYNNRYQLKELSLNGQKKAMNNFTSNINCTNIYETYRELIGMEDIV